MRARKDAMRSIEKDFKPKTNFEAKFGCMYSLINHPYIVNPI